jgi:hypothetical protein
VWCKHPGRYQGILGWFGEIAQYGAISGANGFKRVQRCVTRTISPSSPSAGLDQPGVFPRAARPRLMEPSLQSGRERSTAPLIRRATSPAPRPTPPTTPPAPGADRRETAAPRPTFIGSPAFQRPESGPQNSSSCASILWERPADPTFYHPVSSLVNELPGSLLPQSSLVTLPRDYVPIGPQKADRKGYTQGSRGQICGPR